MNLSPYIADIDRQKLGVEGIVVLKHGEKIAEHRWIPEAPRVIYSTSKSFTSVAVGMAVDDGKLSLDDRVVDAFPGVVREPGDRLARLTLRHLLTMSRGYKEFTRPNSVAEALGHPLTAEPGTVFVYDNACTFLASAMVTEATGRKVRDLLIDRLFGPLGIPDPVWPESDDGYTIGATALEITTSSLAKFGQMLLQKGAWQGRQLVSARWIDAATRARVSTAKARPSEDWNLGYGYQFWMCRHGAYRGDGMLGQYVIVLPDRDAVVAINSEEENMGPILYAVWDHIMPQL